MNIPLFDKDFYKLAFLFFLNLAFLSIVVRWFYYSTTRRKDYLFTFYLVSIIVFFLTFTLKKYNIDVGLALGLFAIFGIIRYRTESIPIREMAYLFIVIGLSIMNALTNKKLSYVEILFSNLAVVVAIGVIEKLWHLKHEVSKKVTYEIIENIKPENYHILKDDLETRTGLEINHLTVGDVDFVKDTATIIIHYNKTDYEK
jgi:hypothetical protein